MNGFTGLYTALITPFKDGKIDYDALGSIIEHQIEGGVDGVVPSGTTGESPTLSHAEHSELIKETVRLVAGRCKVVAGTGSNSTAEALRLSKQACSDGVDGLLLVNPYYNKPTQQGLYLHFKTIAEGVDRPVMLYNIPGRCAVGMELDTINRLSKLDNVVSIKEAAGSAVDMGEIVRVTEGRLTLLSGDDNLMLPCMSVGGHGVVSVISNLYPARTKAILDDFTGGNLKEALAKFSVMSELCKMMFVQTNPIPVKKAMQLKGYCTNEIRLPMTELEERFVAPLKEAMDLFEKAV